MEKEYMKLALSLAQKAQGRTSPNPLVGAVIVNNGEIVGTGYHRKAGTPHAEVHALREAQDKAQGADLYVTLEPCNHQGRTPPCTEALIKAGIKRVFLALKDPNPLVRGQGIERLRQQGIEVHIGILAQEAQKQNEVYLKYIQTKLPFVAVKAAMTLDGKIAAQKGVPLEITGAPAISHSHMLRNIYDAILVGIGTVKADDPRLTCRLPKQEGRDPVRIIVDSKLSIREEAQVLTVDSSAPTLIAVTNQAPESKIKRLQGKAEVLVVNEGKQVDLPRMMEILGQRGITSILVEGGSLINGAFLKENLIDKYYLYFAPKIIGGDPGPGTFGGEKSPLADKITELVDIDWQSLGKDLLLTGYPLRKEGD